MHRYKAMNSAELMDYVFDVYKRSFAKQLTFSALLGVISFVVMFAIGMIAAIIMIIPMADMDVYTDSAFLSVVLMVVLVMMPVYWIWAATAEAGHILLSKQAFYRQPVKLDVRRLPRIVLRVLTATLAQMILSIPWLLIFVAVTYGVARLSGNSFSDVPSLMGFISSYGWIAISIAGAITYVVFSNLFSLAIPVAVFEKQSFFNTIKRSWQLIKGEFWKILGVRMLWLLVSYLFTYSAQGLWAVLMALVSFLSESSTGIALSLTMIGSILQSLVTIAIGFLIGPLTGILTALIYFNQRIKREGLDIEIMLEQISHSPHNRV